MKCLIFLNQIKLWADVQSLVSDNPPPVLLWMRLSSHDPMKQIASKVNELITVRMISRQQGQDRRENRAFPRCCQPLLHLTRGRLNGRVSWRRDEEEEGYLDVLLKCGVGNRAN